VHDGDILFGFSNIKHIGKGTAQYLISLREQYDITSPERLYEVLEAKSEEWKEADPKDRPKKSPRQNFRKDLFKYLYNAGCWDTYEERKVDLKKRQEQERELLKVVLTDESEEVYTKNVDRLEDCNEYADADPESDVSALTLPGMISNVNETKTKKDGKAMGIVTIEYESDEAEFVVFPQQWKKYRFLWKERNFGVFELKKTDRGLSFDKGVKLT
jgi:DNA polymerase III alpha subunit